MTDPRRPPQPAPHRIKIIVEGTAPIRQLAALLKALLRRGGWRCVAIEHEPETNAR